MIKTFGKRIAALAVASAVVAGVTVTYGIPNIQYKSINSSEPVIMTVNGDPVHTDEFRAYLKYNKMYMENMLGYYGYDDSVWTDEQMGNTMVGQLFTMAEQQATYVRILNEEFHNLNLKLTREERENTAQQKREQIEQMGGQDMFDAWLESLDYTMPIYDNTLAASAYSVAIEQAYYGENGSKTTTQEILDKFNETYLCAKHILIQSIDGSGNELTGDALAQAQKKAEEALERVKAGEDFDALIQEYNEDPGMEMYPEGYVFTEGDMVDEFYQAAKALEPGQTSQELVQSSYGWHIIQREPLTEEQMTDAIRSQLIMEITGKTFDQEIDELMATADIQREDSYGEQTYENMMKILGETTESEQPAETPAADAPSTDDAAQ